MAKLKLSQFDPDETGKFKNEEAAEAETEKYL